jgi:hypothetical protein
LPKLELLLVVPVEVVKMAAMMDLLLLLLLSVRLRIPDESFMLKDPLYFSTSPYSL